MESLNGRVVCITSPSGIGTLLARRFADEGARIVISAPDLEELQRVHEELERRGVDVFAFPCDATDEGSVRELVDMAVLWCGRVDVLIMNASSDGELGRTIVQILDPPYEHRIS